MKGFGSTFKTLIKPQRELPDKEILWAVQLGYGNLPNGDSARFPDMNAIAERKNANQPNPLATFVKAFATAQERVWIIDKYFLEPEAGKESQQTRVETILDWMPIGSFSASDIRLITNSHNTHTNKEVDRNLAKQFQEHAECINSYRSKGNIQCQFELRCNLTNRFEYMHDRFAIIDDELWHFGATVGGFHSMVSAATRGWRASEHGAEEFFKLAWDIKPIAGKQK